MGKGMISLSRTLPTGVWSPSTECRILDTETAITVLAVIFRRQERESRRTDCPSVRVRTDGNPSYDRSCRRINSSGQTVPASIPSKIANASTSGAVFSRAGSGVDAGEPAPDVPRFDNRPKSGDVGRRGAATTAEHGHAGFQQLRDALGHPLRRLGIDPPAAHPRRRAGVGPGEQ